jgi:enamine deaminase RidA (YjgF/YER057c/UK114 family)
MTDHFDPEARLKELGLKLPEQRVAVGNYIGAFERGGFVFVAGHGPFSGPKQLFKGKLGRDMDVASGHEAAAVSMLNALASLKTAIGDLGRVDHIIRLFGMVNSTPDFEDHPKVIDGASDVLTNIFGERGKHVRCAVGFSSLPFGMPVELEMTVALR